MRRYAETIFRYWTLAILPILILPLGAYFLTKSPVTTVGTTNIWADQSSLQALPYVQQGVTPSANMASYLSQLVLSPSFDMAVARHSPLYLHSLLASPDPKSTIATDFGKNVQITAAGPTLVSVAYTSRTPGAVNQVLRSILTEAANETILLNQQQAAKDSKYLNNQLKAAQSQYTRAASGLGTYMSDHGIAASTLDLRQLTDVKLASLYQAVQNARTNITNYQQQLSTVSTQEQLAAQNTFRVMDPASAQVVVASKKKKLTGLIIPLALGILVSGAFVVVKTALDRSLQHPGEVESLLGIRLLGTVPYSRALAGSKEQSNRARANASNIDTKSIVEQTG